MGRSPCCDKVGLKKGPWTPEEDQKLLAYIEENGHGSWRALPSKAGLQRCGKSCRLRWTNYLRPDIKRGKFSLQEEQTIIQLHALLGNRWSAIATHLPKRTDNEIKNYWNTHLKKRLSKMGIDPVTHKPKKDTMSNTTQSGGGGAGSVMINNKTAANLSHMAQWESARLEAEARLVRQSKLLSLHSFSAASTSASPSMIVKAEPPPPPPPPPHHHEHDWTDQLAISCCSSMEGTGGGGGGPWSPDNENDNHHHDDSSYDKDNIINNNSTTHDDHDDSVGEEGFINLLLSADHHQEDTDDNNINNNGSGCINYANAAEEEEEMKQQDSTLTTDNNSTGRSTSTSGGDRDCCYEEEDINNKNYWNTILNLVDTTSPNSPHDHHTPIF